MSAVCRSLFHRRVAQIYAGWIRDKLESRATASVSPGCGVLVTPRTEGTEGDLTPLLFDFDKSATSTRNPSPLPRRRGPQGAAAPKIWSSSPPRLAGAAAKRLERSLENFLHGSGTRVLH